MLIQLNEQPCEVADRATVAEVAAQFRPGADVMVVNGYPAPPEQRLVAGDRLVLIVRGTQPPLVDLAAQLAARHTPGVYARLRTATVGIAGCGGLGSNVALALARSGVGTLVVADFDVVEPSNLNRQAYFVDQIGCPKVEALSANLARANPMVRVETHPLRLTAQNVPQVFARVDVLVEALDAAEQKAMLLDTALRVWPRRPLVLGLGMAGYGANSALHERRAGSLRICGDERAAAGPGLGLMAPRVGVVAHLQANAVLELLLGPDGQLAKTLEENPQ